VPTPSEIQTCINNLTTGSQPIGFTLLSAETSNAAETLLATGISFSVATVNDLPDLETTLIGQGQIVFVESIGVPVISTENAWKGLDGRLLRSDFVARSIFTWGINSCGQIGDGTTVDKCSPVREYCCATDWCQVSAGYVHSTAVKTTGELWGWGQGCEGQLGDANLTVIRGSPVREFCSATDWCQVSAGNRFTVAIKTSGELWSWGINTCGRLGDGTVTRKCSPVREFCSATDWCQVSAGDQHTTAIKTSGELWSWGIGTCGRLGDGTTISRCSPVREFCSATNWCQVSSETGVLAIKTTGEIWGWGNNCCGSLGDGTTVAKCSPIREICSATDWCQVSGPFSASGAIKTSGELWSWGNNNCGRLGDGTSITRCSPVREFCSATNWCQIAAGGACHHVAIKTSGELWAWGRNNCGTIGDGTTTSRCSPVREVTFSTDWCQVKTGRNFTTAIRLKL
jgi:alpha-tubulin suppressor-like RCC1 family protein